MKIAVLTSGGDSQGMNAALVGVVKMALANQVEIFAIYEGYAAGGEYIKKMTWSDVSGIIQHGGTAIGTARCQEFREIEGRKTATKNLIENGIDHLIVIGGDGSLTGADLLRREWADHVSSLIEDKTIKKQQALEVGTLTVVGLVGSIDNDMCGTDLTIGANTALERIVSACDSIASTASSHKRSFVVEVMGRNCGYLALAAGIITGADWVFIPEHAPKENWEKSFCYHVEKRREMGRRCTIVIISEGAIDYKGNPISSSYIKSLLDNIGVDTRVTILGHVQRGGLATPFDRSMSLRMGAKATQLCLSQKYKSRAILLGCKGQKIVKNDLVQSVEDTKAVTQAIKNGQFEKSQELRGGQFLEMVDLYVLLNKISSRTRIPSENSKTIAVMCTGAPAPGMNAVVRIIVRTALSKGYKVLAIHDGFKGLESGNIEEFDWLSVSSWIQKGGTLLGSTRKIPKPSSFEKISDQIKSFKIDSLIIVGGFEGYHAAKILSENCETFPHFSLPIICIPATISNNLPGTDESIGADRALTNVTDAADKLAESGLNAKRTYIMEIMGKYCGYQTLMSGLASDSYQALIHEVPINLKYMQSIITDLKIRYSQKLIPQSSTLIIRNEMASSAFTTDFTSAILQSESEDIFAVRTSILGHLQQGGNGTCIDRLNGSILGYETICYLDDYFQKKNDNENLEKQVMIGIINGKTKFTPISQFYDLVDFEFRRPKYQWWMKLYPIFQKMSQTDPQIYSNAQIPRKENVIQFNFEKNQEIAEKRVKDQYKKGGLELPLSILFFGITLSLIQKTFQK